MTPSDPPFPQHKLSNLSFPYGRVSHEIVDFPELVEMPPDPEAVAPTKVLEANHLALAFSGGGTKGDFEVGVVQYLKHRDIDASIYAGTSVGAINASKCAEGPDGVNELVDLWLGLTHNSDMWEARKWFKDAYYLIRAAKGRRATSLIFSVVSTGTGALTFPWEAHQLGINIWQYVGDAKAASKSSSLLTLRPIALKLHENLDPARVAGSGKKLRLTMVSLESGLLRVVDETGHFLDDGKPFPLQKAVLASASIPGIFAPVTAESAGELTFDHFVDGGVREVVPIKAAVEADADHVIAVLTRPTTGVAEVSGDAVKSLGEIVLRTANDMLIDEVMQGDIAGPWDIPVTLIVPRFDIHDSLLIDPGLIRIAMDYGWMCADDALHLDPRTRRRDLIMRAGIADQIFLLRREAWLVEHTVLGREVPSMFPVLGHEVEYVPDPNFLGHVRNLKQRIRDLVQRRHGHGGAVPAHCADWWMEWEAHGWDENEDVSRNPWNLFASRTDSVPATAPPLPLDL